MSQQDYRMAMMSHMPIFCALYACQMNTLAHYCSGKGENKEERYLVNGMVYVTFVALLLLTVIAFAQSMNVRVHNPDSA